MGAFLEQICGLCNKEMTLVEGDSIFGEKWYHHDCWGLIAKREEESKCKQ